MSLPQRKVMMVEASLTTRRITGFAIQQQFWSKSLGLAGARCYRQYHMCCYTSLFRNRCHYILAAIPGRQIVLLQCWQSCLFYNGDHHILVTTTVVRRGRGKWVIHDQCDYISWPFALENGVGYANCTTRGQEPGSTGRTPCWRLKWEVTRVRRKPQKSCEL